MDELIRKQAVLNMIDNEQFERYFTHAELELLSRMWLAVNAIPSVDAMEVVRCKDCKYFELNHWDGIIITAHEICNKWADGCKTNKDGYCFMGERKTDG